MRNALPVAIAPFAAVLLLARPNMVLVQMLNQIVHVLKVSSIAAVPLAYCNLVVAVVIVGGHARVVRRGGNTAIRVLRYLAIAIRGR